MKAALTSMFISLTPWTILHVYKTRPVGPGILSPEELGSYAIESPPEVETDLQIDVNGLVSRIDTSGHDSSTTNDEGAVPVKSSWHIV